MKRILRIYSNYVGLIQDIEDGKLKSGDTPEEALAKFRVNCMPYGILSALVMTKADNNAEWVVEEKLV